MDPKSFHSIGLAPVVQKIDEDIHWMRLYPLDNAIGFCNTYLLDSDFFWWNPVFEQTGLGRENDANCKDIRLVPSDIVTYLNSLTKMFSKMHVICLIRLFKALLTIHVSPFPQKKQCLSPAGTSLLLTEQL